MDLFSVVGKQTQHPRGLLGKVLFRWMTRATIAHARWTVDLMNVQADDDIVEIGFGNGANIEILAGHASNGHKAGADDSETAVEMASKKNAKAISEGRVTLRQAGGGSLPFDEGAQKEPALKYAKQHGCVPRPLGDLLLTGSAFLLQFLQARHRGLQQLEDDRRRDVGHDAQPEDRNLAELRRAQQQYYALAVRVRGTARALVRQRPDGIEKLNDRQFQKLDGCRRSAFESIDRPAMQPLPAKRFEIGEWKTAGVNIDYHVDYDRRLYSVPHTMVGETVVMETKDVMCALIDGENLASLEDTRRLQAMLTKAEG